MIRQLILGYATAAILVTAVSAEAQSRKRYPPGYYQERERDWDNRRDARRAGLVTAIVVSGATKAAQDRRIEERYRDCLRGTYYDVECDRRRYYEESEARNRARRAGFVAGAVMREAVRN